MSVPMTRRPRHRRRRRRRRCVCWLRFSLLHMSVVSIPSFHLPFLKIKIKINKKRQQSKQQLWALRLFRFFFFFFPERNKNKNKNNNNNNPSGKGSRWVDGGGRLWLVGWLVGKGKVIDTVEDLIAFSFFFLS